VAPAISAAGDVVRVLHDASDLERHLPEEYLRNSDLADPDET